MTIHNNNNHIVDEEKEKEKEKGKSTDQKFADLIANMHWWREKIGKDKCKEFFSKFKSIAIHKQDQGR
jgi:hypothetical protein